MVCKGLALQWWGISYSCSSYGELIGSSSVNCSSSINWFFFGQLVLSQVNCSRSIAQPVLLPLINWLTVIFVSISRRLIAFVPTSDARSDLNRSHGILWKMIARTLWDVRVGISSDTASRHRIFRHPHTTLATKTSNTAYVNGEHRIHQLLSGMITYTYKSQANVLAPIFFIL